jgi:hypothetical protein
MTFKSTIPPLCRYCGAKIRKRTGTVYFGQETPRVDGSWTYRSELPRSRDEAQRYTNETIVSVRWAHMDDDPRARRHGFEFVDQVGTWDGESYVDEFFCNGEHAKRFAYVHARAGQATEAWVDAENARTLEQESSS